MKTYVFDQIEISRHSPALKKKKKVDGNKFMLEHTNITLNSYSCIIRIVRLAIIIVEDFFFSLPLSLFSSFSLSRFFT